MRHKKETRRVVKVEMAVWRKSPLSFREEGRCPVEPDGCPVNGCFE